MGARGPKADTAEIKAAKGNTRRQRKDPVEAAPEPSKVDRMPAYLTPSKSKLSKHGARVRAKTAQIVAFLQVRLQTINLLKETDVNGFWRYCRYMAEWLVCIEVSDEEGEWYLAKSEHNPEGLWRTHPAAKKIPRLELNLRMLEVEFGLTPGRRQQIMMMMAAQNIAIPTGAMKQPEESEGLYAMSGPIGMGASRLPH